jgi:hypothetical protein
MRGARPYRVAIRNAVTVMPGAAIEKRACSASSFFWA